MVDTVRSIAELLDAMPVGVEAGTSVQDIRDVVVTLAPKHASLYDTTDQAITTANVSQVITFDTEVSLDGFSHTGGEITILETMDGVQITGEFEVNNGSGSNTLKLWIEGEPAAGGGFVAAPGSAEEVIIPSNSEEVLVVSRILTTFANGDKIRFRMQGDSTNLSLNATAASGDVPIIPSAVVAIHKL